MNRGKMFPLQNIEILPQNKWLNKILINISKILNDTANLEPDYNGKLTYPQPKYGHVHVPI